MFQPGIMMFMTCWIHGEGFLQSWILDLAAVIVFFSKLQRLGLRIRDDPWAEVSMLCSRDLACG